MFNTKQILAASLAILMASASSALAGTKAQANLVPATDPLVPNPTIATKGKVQLKDTGALSVSVKGLTDGSAAPVTSVTEYDPVDPNSLAADHYIAVLKLSVVGAAPAMGVPAVQVEYVVPLSIKKGNGSAKLDLAGLMSFLSALGNVNRSFEVQGGEFWGPIGSGLATCKSLVMSGAGGMPVAGVSPAFVIDDDGHYALDGQGFPIPWPDCRVGTRLGVLGINVP
jgi:hypothetical protein